MRPLETTTPRPATIEGLGQRFEPECPVEALSEHPENPRRGDVGAISESIEANGFFGAVLVQASSGHVIAGNHRLKAALALGLATVPALYIDVDDDQAKRIMLADNRSNDLASYDDAALAKLLGSVGGSLVGTGYTDQDLAALLGSLNEFSYQSNGGSGSSKYPTNEEAAERYASTDVRSLYLDYAISDFDRIVDLLATARARYGVDSNAAAVMAALEVAVGAELAVVAEA
jgi:hypothetical protein